MKQIQKTVAYKQPNLLGFPEGLLESGKGFFLFYSAQCGASAVKIICDLRLYLASSLSKRAI